MRIASLQEVQAGSYLARSIYNTDGKKLLLGEGTKLDGFYVNRLKELGYHSIFVVDKYTEDIPPVEIIGPALRMEANSVIYDFHHHSDFLSDTRKFEVLRELVRTLIYEIIRSDKGITVEFPEIKTFENYVYQHSVNVAVMGTLIGWHLGFKESLLEDFAVGALLHDIGKIVVPPEILNKAGSLSDAEYEIIKHHPRDGFNLLNKSIFIKPRSFAISLQHHETFDGSGYPSGKKGEEIHIFSRVGTIVDIFDALTSDRPYKGRWSFSKVLNYMNKEIKKRLDSKVLEVFDRVIPPYPLGSTVNLTTGERAIIFKNNPLALSSPQVRIIRDAKGQIIPPESSYEVNLVEHPEIKIVSLLENGTV